MGELRERAYSFIAEQLIEVAAGELFDLMMSEMLSVVLPIAEQTYARGFAGWCADIDSVEARVHLFETRLRVTWRVAQLVQAYYDYLCEELDRG